MTDRRHNTRVAMWAAIGGSLALLGTLLLAGVGQRAWSIAAAVLVIACIAACLVSVRQGSFAEREVRRAVDRLGVGRTKDAREQHRDKNADRPQ